MKIFVERPIATAMIFMALLVLGVYSFMNLPLELAPKEEFPELNINTSWQGVPPEVIQTEITAPIEEKVSTVKGIRKIYSCLLYTSPSPRDRTRSRMPSSA